MTVPPAWLLAAGGGVGVVAVGLLPPSAAGDVLARTAGVLVFLVAVTVLAELCEAAGVFDAAAGAAARAARGRTWRLFALVVVLACVTTVVLSLDTTAVLLTPVVLALCARLGLAPLPFAMTTVWLASTASLLLPVSNLTNLLAVQRSGLDVLAFAARMWPAALVAVALTVAVLVVLHGRHLRGTYTPPARAAVADRVLFATCTAAVAGFAAAVVAGVDVTLAAVAAASAAALGFAVRRRTALRRVAVPWRLVLLAGGLFVVVEAAHRHGLGTALAVLSGTGDGTGDGTGEDAGSLLRLAAAGALASNAVNNLPAYLALEPVAGGSVDRLLALVVGVNCGALLTTWGTLATLLWRERCAARGLDVSARRFLAEGLAVVPVVVVGTTLALAFTR